MNNIVILNKLNDVINWAARNLNKQSKCIGMLGFSTILTGLMFCEQARINKDLAKEIDKLKEELNALKGE